MCECYVIGGPFIGADPDCPAHGIAAQQREEEQAALQERVRFLEQRVRELESSEHAQDSAN